MSDEENERANDVSGDEGIQHFDTTITKLVERENEDGDKEWVTVMSDNLYPGEKLKRDEDEKAEARKKELAEAKAHKLATERKEEEEAVLSAKREHDAKN